MSPDNKIINLSTSKTPYHTVVNHYIHVHLLNYICILYFHSYTIKFLTIIYMSPDNKIINLSTSKTPYHTVVNHYIHVIPYNY
jgi:hypothetical protein